VTTVEVQSLLQTDPQFVYVKRFDYNLTKLLGRYPDGCPDHVIAGALMITEDDVEKLYASIVVKIRLLMGVARPT
jgi:hypothetical protein